MFFEHIVHEVFGGKAKYNMKRVSLGWRLTKETESLLPGLKEDLKNQAVMRLKSKQFPPMYAALHWTNWRDKLKVWSDKSIIDSCKETRRVESGAHKGESFQIVYRQMPSLKQLGLPLFPAYKKHERGMHVPSSEWTILGPGRNSLRQTIKLKREDEEETETETDEETETEED